MAKEELKLISIQMWAGGCVLLFLGFMVLMIMEFFGKPGHPFGHPKATFVISAAVCSLTFGYIYLRLHKLLLQYAQLLKKSRQGEMDSLYARVATSDHC